MSYRIGKVVVIRDEGDAECELCGKVDELRPYGPGGKCICFECGMKDQELTKHNAGVWLFGDEGELK